MTKSKGKPASKAKPEPVQFVLMSGKHSRRLADGNSIVFRPGDIVEDLSDAELSAFGDKFLTVEEFKARAAGFDRGQESEAARREARAKAEAVSDAPRDEQAEERAATIADMNEADQASRIRM